MRLILLFLLASCATSQTFNPITYKGIGGRCPLVYLQFKSNPDFNCYCKVEVESDSQDNHVAYIYIPVKSQYCRPNKTEVKEIK